LERRTEEGFKNKKGKKKTGLPVVGDAYSAAFDEECLSECDEYKQCYGACWEIDAMMYKAPINIGMCWKVVLAWKLGWGLEVVGGQGVNIKVPLPIVDNIVGGDDDTEVRYASAVVVVVVELVVILLWWWCAD